LSSFFSSWKALSARCIMREKKIKWKSFFPSFKWCLLCLSQKRNKGKKKHFSYTIRKRNRRQTENLCSHVLKLLIKLFYKPCISIPYCPISFELLDIVPRDEPEDDDELVPDLNRIFVVCWRSSIVIVSSGDVGRARGHMKLWKWERIW
jgi:hypothetical protein